jgi:two-component sensor histidine kinase
MQIIASLLRLTDLQSNIPEVHEVIRDCRNRIFSMASIHEKLYETENLTKIPLGEYIRDVGKRIILEFEMTYEQMTYDVIEDQAMYVDINTGIPIGLLINELITNSLKHAFRPTCHGAITVQIRNNGDFC